MSARVMPWVAPLLLVSSVALAQMDAAQMSGIPRADKAVPEGVLTVKLIRGELGAWAPAGTEVHLVGMTKDDQVTHLVAKTNEEGRAEFTELAHDGSTVYYAMAMVGEERLTSEPVLLPPKIGVRMALSSAKKGEPPKDNEALSGGGGDPHSSMGKRAAMPKGEVELLVRGGKLGNELKAVLRSVAGGGEPTEIALSGAEDAMTGRFTGVPVGGPYVTEVKVGSKVYRSTPFQMNGTAGVQRMILIYDELLFAVQGGAQPEDDRMWFELTMTLANVSSAPISPGPEGVVLPLPVGFRSAKIKEEDGPFKVVEGQGVVSPGPVPPGQMSTTVQFAMPIHDGRVEVDMPAPFGMFQSHIGIVKGSTTRVSSTSLGKAPRVQRGDDMREFYILDGFSIKPGESLQFSIAGLPMPAVWQSWSKNLAGAIVVALLALALAVALIGRRRPTASRPVDAEAARRELAARREKLYGELVTLERLRAAERIDEGDFDAQRKAIMTRLVLVHRELDDLDGAGVAGGQARVS